MSVAKLPMYLVSWLVGIGFFMYGWRNRVPVPLLCGLALMVIPYFIDDIKLFIAIGAVLVVVPLLFRP